MEQNLELENTHKIRLQTALERSKDQIEQLNNERDRLVLVESNERERCRKISRQLREAQNEQCEAVRRSDMAQRRADDAQIDADKAHHEAACSRNELSILLRRIQELENFIKSKNLDENDLEEAETLFYGTSADSLFKPPIFSETDFFKTFDKEISLNSFRK